jgi:alkanesulfonate monooxygenase SsuD/methylene tetrahydromethanopterin reductase-like flavin-dependent oxidoreductase (luciferase family)
MRLGVYGMPVDREGLDYVVEAERLGVDSVWVPEFWANRYETSQRTIVDEAWVIFTCD